MAWLTLLVIFWKPIYKVGMYVWKKDPVDLDAAKDWFVQLWGLVKP